MKTKEKQIRKRTRKYFYHQKWGEVRAFFNDTWQYFCAFLIPLGLLAQAGWGTYPPCPIVAIIGLCILGFWIIVGLIMLIKCIAKWLSSNWKKARAKAENDFK